MYYPKVSVIIPVYNREKTIKRALESVVNQDYENLEIIVIDDGSLDSTRREVESINDCRIRYIKNDKNMGASFSRNKGIKAAIGDYIAFQDSDDVWRKNKISKSVEVIQMKNVDIVFSGMIKYANLYRRYLPNYNLNCFENKYLRLLEDNCISNQTVVGNKKCFLAEYFDETLSKLQDWDLYLRLSRKYSIYYIDEALVDVYMQSDSITYSGDMIDSLKKIYQKNRKVIDENYNLKYMFKVKIGKAKARKGEKIISEFVEAGKIKKRAYIYIILTRLHLWRVIDAIRNIIKALVSFWGIWRVK